MPNPVTRPDNPPISTIGVTTADRPQLLERCLWSLTRQLSAHGTHARLIVVDASKDSHNESLGRAAVSAIRRATDHAISFIGRKEKLAIRQALRAFCDDSLLELAFQPGASGNRNIILLLSSGENVLFVDDDVVCDAWRPLSFRRGIALGGHVEQRNIAFYARRENVYDGLVKARVGLLDAHQTVLGRTVRSMVTSKSLAVDARPACGHLRRAARGLQPARVRMTFTGIAGDAGVTYPDRLLFSTGTWKAVLAGSRKSFDTAFKSREVCKVGNRYIVMHEFACMTGCLGFSNTSIAPPFLPVGRNEDGLFGATVSAIDPDVVACHLPYAVIHASARSPRYSGRRFPSARETRFADLLISLIRLWVPRMRANDSRRRLIRLGEWLQHLATLRKPDFVRVTSLVTLETREMELTRIESALADRDGYPVYWQRDLRSYQALLLKNARKAQFQLPLEFHHARTISAGYDELRKFVRRAGELYVAWPTLWMKGKTILRDFPGE